MQDVFERTWAYLGDEMFEACARKFIDAHPARERTLNGLGDNFPDWLWGEYPDDGEIAEVARIDAMLRRAFDGADAAPLRADALTVLSARDWATATFAFHPTTAMAPLHFNAAGVWEALDQGRPPPAATLLPQPAILLVWRRDVRPHFRCIDSAEAATIEWLCAGASFASAGERLAAEFPQADASEMLGKWLRQWLADELLVGCHR